MPTTSPTVDPPRKRRLTVQAAVLWIAEHSTAGDAAEEACVLFAAAFLDADPAKVRAAVAAQRAKLDLDAKLAALTGGA